MASQRTPHVPPTQSATPWDGGSGQALQRAPHDAGLVFDKQLPLQTWVPVGHIPLHAIAVGMQAPLHSLVPAVGHDATQPRPSQVTVPPVGIWQASHAMGPQVARSLLLTQRWPQT